MKIKNIVIILIIFLLISLIIYNNVNKLEHLNDSSSLQINVPSLPRPFVNLYNDKGEKVNVILVSHPFTRATGTNGSYEQYVQYKKEGIHFIGISSYGEFPGVVTNPHDSISPKDHEVWTKYDYMKLLPMWLHCFRDPDKYIDKNIPKILISESDFVNENNVLDTSVEKEYDFIYICLKDNDECKMGWQGYNRNWELALKCIEIMCSKYKLKGVLVGRINCQIPTSCKNLMIITDRLPKNKLVEYYKKSKFIFLPNIVDASPRVLTEAFNYNLRALVNYNILGGWKYINNKTGELFTEDNFEEALTKLLNNYDSYEPYKYFKANYGINTTGVQLRDFLLEHLDNLNFTKESTKYIKI